MEVIDKIHDDMTIQDVLRCMAEITAIIPRNTLQRSENLFKKTAWSKSYSTICKSDFHSQIILPLIQSFFAAIPLDIKGAFGKDVMMLMKSLRYDFIVTDPPHQSLRTGKWACVSCNSPFVYTVWDITDVVINHKYTYHLCPNCNLNLAKIACVYNYLRNISKEKRCFQAIGQVIEYNSPEYAFNTFKKFFDQ